MPPRHCLVPLKSSGRNSKFPHRVPFTKEKMPWCPLALSKIHMNSKNLCTFNQWTEIVKAQVVEPHAILVFERITTNRFRLSLIDVVLHNAHIVLVLPPSYTICTGWLTYILSTVCKQTLWIAFWSIFLYCVHLLAPSLWLHATYSTLFFHAIKLDIMPILI